MPKQFQIQGYAAELARGFNKKGSDTKSLATAANARLDPVVRRMLFESLSESLRAKRGLSMDPHTGKLAVAQVVESAATTPAAGHEAVSSRSSATLVEVAGAIAKAYVARRPSIHQNSNLYIVNYSKAKAVGPRSAERVLANSATYRERLNVMRRAPSIAEAEVSHMLHGGAYDNNGVGFDGVQAHGASILDELTKSPEHITWQQRQQTGNVTYGAWLAPLNDGSYTPTIVRTEILGQALEIGAKLGYVGVERYAESLGRVFSLTTESFFAADASLFGEILGNEPKPGELYGLSGNTASKVAEHIGNPESLVPSYTTFVVTQEVLGRPQAATLEHFSQY